MQHFAPATPAPVSGQLDLAADYIDVRVIVDRVEDLEIRATRGLQRRSGRTRAA